jgi:hypothetical protein
LISFYAFTQIYTNNYIINFDYLKNIWQHLPYTRDYLQFSNLQIFTITTIVTHFWVPTKNEKIQKKISKKFSEEIQKIIGARKGCWNAEKIPKLVKEIQKCKRLKFDSESPVDKENSI